MSLFVATILTGHDGVGLSIVRTDPIAVPGNAEEERVKSAQRGQFSLSTLDEAGVSMGQGTYLERGSNLSSTGP
jgi:hypothetical protein